MWPTVVSAVSCLKSYDRARHVAPRADSASACAGQHIMAAPIIPAHQIGLDGLLSEHHGHRILNMAWCDIAMHVDLSQGLDQSFYLGVYHCRLKMVPNEDLCKDSGSEASHKLDEQSRKGQASNVRSWRDSEVSECAPHFRSLKVHQTSPVRPRSVETDPLLTYWGRALNDCPVPQNISAGLISRTAAR
jgi:hypothetical protein